MHIPRAWARAEADAQHDGRSFRILETIGGASPRGAAARFLDLHDRETRAGEDLPLP